MIYREGKSFPFFSFASIHLSLLFRPRFCCEPSSCCQCCFAREENIKAWLGLVGCWSPLLFWLRPYLLRIDHFSTRLFLFFFFLLLFFLIEKELKVAVDVLRDRARWRLYFFLAHEIMRIDSIPTEMGRFWKKKFNPKIADEEKGSKNPIYRHYRNTLFQRLECF